MSDIRRTTKIVLVFELKTSAPNDKEAKERALSVLGDILEGGLEHVQPLLDDNELIEWETYE